MEINTSMYHTFILRYYVDDIVWHSKFKIHEIWVPGMHLNTILIFLINVGWLQVVPAACICWFLTWLPIPPWRWRRHRNLVAHCSFHKNQPLFLILSLQLHIICIINKFQYLLLRYSVPSNKKLLNFSFSTSAVHVSLTSSSWICSPLLWTSSLRSFLQPETTYRGNSSLRLSNIMSYKKAGLW